MRGYANAALALATRNANNAALATAGNSTALQAEITPLPHKSVRLRDRSGLRPCASVVVRLRLRGISADDVEDWIAEQLIDRLSLRPIPAQCGSTSLTKIHA